MLRGTNQASYTYDAANRLTAVTGWDSNSIQYAYDDANRMTSATLPSSTGIVSAYAYLADGLGSTMAVVDASGVAQKSYQYDVYGEVTGGSGSLPLPPAAAAHPYRPPNPPIDCQASWAVTVAEALPPLDVPPS